MKKCLHFRNDFLMHVRIFIDCVLRVLRQAGFRDYHCLLAWRIFDGDVGVDYLGKGVGGYHFYSNDIEAFL